MQFNVSRAGILLLINRNLISRDPITCPILKYLQSSYGVLCLQRTTSVVPPQAPPESLCSPLQFHHHQDRDRVHHEEHFGILDNVHFEHCLLDSSSGCSSDSPQEEGSVEEIK